MLREFTVDFRSHEVWEFKIALALSAAGSGAALLFFSFLVGSKAGTLVGLGMDCLGVAALFVDLGHRMRFWRAISKTTQTWISLGTLVTTGLIVFGVLYLLTPEANPLAMPFKIISLVCSLAVMLYASFPSPFCLFVTNYPFFIGLPQGILSAYVTTFDRGANTLFP